MKATPSKSSPRGGNRACLCKDGKYSKKCCNGDLQAQGIGVITGSGSEASTVTNIVNERTIN